MNLSKSVIVLLGMYRGLDVTVPGPLTVEAWINRASSGDERELRQHLNDSNFSSSTVFSLTGDVAIAVPKWHGVHLAGGDAITAQWTAHAAEAEARAADIITRRSESRDGARAREMQARWGIASKLTYAMKYQVPHNRALCYARLRRNTDPEGHGIWQR